MINAVKIVINSKATLLGEGLVAQKMNNKKTYVYIACKEN